MLSVESREKSALVEQQNLKMHLYLGKSWLEENSVDMTCKRAKRTMQLLWKTIVTSFSLIYSNCASESNLALGKQTSASSTRLFSPSVVVDGSDDFNWRSESCFANRGTDMVPWWMVDLGETFRVTNVSVSNRGDCLCYDRLHDFGIEIFTNSPTVHPGLPWSLCAYHPGPVARGATVNFTCDVTGRFVRVRRNITHSDSDLFTICEVKVFGTQHTDTCPKYNTVMKKKMGTTSSTGPESLELCGRQCSSLPSCVGFNYKPNSPCEIVETPLAMTDDVSWTYFYKRD